MERNRLLGAFVLLAAVNLALGTTFHFRLPWEQLGGYAPFLLIGAKLLYVYAVYRASRLLGQAWWLTALFVALAPFAGFEVIPVAALLIGVRVARGGLEEPS